MPDVKLRLHIDHPTYEETYSFGYECAKAGMTEEENPYTQGASAHDDWLEGWWAGVFEEEPLFELTETKTTWDTDAPIVINLAANEETPVEYGNIITNVLTIAGAITVTAVIGYQIMELVA